MKEEMAKSLVLT